ncbi:hypothetical protein [Roseinatronobacter bogoriensis]|uniref:DUF304 domain-containing protein n=1 Tax=Roseinatronobacter bogoriensis subsp. barguzinensis TaxID=441209 RepID=A0A2K8KKF1_9RHOB|nr:hypothetical protein [Rhodobaca]ATX66860.1 hypothetical protein BG454_14380 [Rhodobaca barguzinensis]MBB4206334.1 hypothetical protein [Rhodobaca bogoriensis DSM 18756]TDW41079.1 hypothetical protein LY39_00177 [Rhodobaca barguzinensis]TDY74743.1 hypothetical protein EV660_101787 [Rhodobaca bogoriensis DSM 18756]
MAEEIRESRLADTVFEPEPGEKILREIRSDKATYWRDHGVMAVLGMGVVGMVLSFIGSDHVAIGSLGAVLALAVRGLWLYSEQMKFRWVLSNMRLVGPGGRQVYLLELEKARRLFGDIQLITRSGDKHLIKHIAQSENVVAEIEAARDKRAKRKGA